MNNTPTISEVGPKLWRELHLRALDWEGSAPDDAYLRRLVYRLRYVAPNCDCSRFYREWKEKNSPTYHKYFEWTVQLHNAVNTKLDKPNMSLSDARAHWKRVGDDRE